MVKHRRRKTFSSIFSLTAEDVDDLIVTFDDSIEFRDRLRHASDLIMLTDLGPDGQKVLDDIPVNWHSPHLFRYLSYDIEDTGNTTSYKD